MKECHVHCVSCFQKTHAFIGWTYWRGNHKNKPYLALLRQSHIPQKWLAHHIHSWFSHHQHETKEISNTKKPEQNGRPLADDILDAFSWKKIVYSDLSLNGICSWGSNWQWVSIGSGNGLVPVWHQAISWAYDDPYVQYVVTQCVNS